MRSIIAGLLTFLVGFTAAAQDFSGRMDYSGHRVVRVLLEEPEDLDAMLAVSEDFWAESLSLGPMDFRIPPDRQAALDATGLSYAIVIPDLGPLIAAEEASILLSNSLRDVSWFTDYKTLAQIDARLDELVAQRPDLVTKFTIGTSIQGRPIHGIRIADDSSGVTNRPGILLNATQHAREWISPMTVMYIADRLVETESSDTRVAALLDHTAFYVIPVVNPDGYEFSWTTQRLWRKNRRANSGGTFGVDLNRNWATGWGGTGSSGSGSSDTYRGTAPFSEPESAALRDFMVAQTDLRAHIDFHSYSQLVLRPWGYIASEPGGQGGAVLTALGDEMAAAIFDIHGQTYVSEPAHQLYIASGVIIDWAWEQLGIYSWTIELRPATANPGFILPAEQIIPTCEENYEAMLRLAEQISLGLKVTAVDLPTTVAPFTPVPVVVEVIEIDATLDAATLHARIGSSGPFDSLAMTALGGGLYSADLPGAACGTVIQYYLEFATTDGRGAVSPINAPNSLYAALVIEESTVLYDDMEAPSGWTGGLPGDTATTGIWERVIPVGTAAQPGDCVSGDFCWVTGQGQPGGAIGANDVDGGYTTLLSPAFDLSAHPEAVISYWRWYSNNQGAAPNTDVFTVDISNDDGASWSNVEVIGPAGPLTGGGWFRHNFRVADILPPTAAVRLRFIADDQEPGSIVEAAVDDLLILTYSCPTIDCPGDANGDGEVGLADLLTVLGAYGKCVNDPGFEPGADFDVSGCVDLADLLTVLGRFGTTCE